MVEQLDLDIKKNLLLSQPIFSGLTDDEINILCTLLTEKSILPGDIIVKEGDLVDSVYVIVSGKADVKKATLKDHPDQLQTIATLGPEDAIGLNETGFYSISGIRTATVVALTEMIVLRLSVAAFHGFALSHPHVNEVMRKYSGKILTNDS